MLHKVYTHFVIHNFMLNFMDQIITIIWVKIGDYPPIDLGRKVGPPRRGSSNETEYPDCQAEKGKLNIPADRTLSLFKMGVL